jgi:hypothetical protein
MGSLLLHGLRNPLLVHLRHVRRRLDSLFVPGTAAAVLSLERRWRGSTEEAVAESLVVIARLAGAKLPV